MIRSCEVCGGARASRFTSPVWEGGAFLCGACRARESAFWDGRQIATAGTVLAETAVADGLQSAVRHAPLSGIVDSAFSDGAYESRDEARYGIERSISRRWKNSRHFYLDPEQNGAETRNWMEFMLDGPERKFYDSYQDRHGLTPSWLWRERRDEQRQVSCGEAGEKGLGAGTARDTQGP